MRRELEETRVEGMLGNPDGCRTGVDCTGEGIRCTCCGEMLQKVCMGQGTDPVEKDQV